MPIAEDPMIPYLVSKYAEIVTLFEELRGNVRIDISELRSTKAELEKTIRDVSSSVATLRDEVRLAHESADMDAANAINRRRGEIEVYIRNLSAEGARAGFKDGAETAIQEAMGKSFVTLRQELQEIATLMSRLRKERAGLWLREFRKRVSDWLTPSLFVLFLLTLAVCGFWATIGKPYCDTISANRETARAWELVWENLDEHGRSLARAAYQKGIDDLAAKTADKAHVAESERIAQVARKDAQEAKAEADKAEEEAVLRAVALRAAQVQLKLTKNGQ